MQEFDWNDHPTANPRSPIAIDTDVSGASIMFLRRQIASAPEVLMPRRWAEDTFGSFVDESTIGKISRPIVSTRYAIVIPTPTGAMTVRNNSNITLLATYYDRRDRSHKVARADYGCAHVNIVHSSRNCYHKSECPDCGLFYATDSGD